MDDRTNRLINVISMYLQDHKIDFSSIAFDDIENHPEKKPYGICFSPLSKIDSTGIRYLILIYSQFEKTISVIRETFLNLLSTNSRRMKALKKALSKDNDYLFIFAFMHEIGHIQHIKALKIDDDMFFNPLTGLNSNPNNNFIYENYADQFSLLHTDAIYKLLKSLE